MVGLLIGLNCAISLFTDIYIILKYINIINKIKILNKVNKNEKKTEDQKNEKN